MRVIYERCAGLDVHKKSVVACRVFSAEGKGWQTEVRTFGTMTRDLLQLSDWLTEGGVTHVAMESTGVYWKPVYNLLEGSFTTWVVNARSIKQVPGRKTDVKDAQWIAELLQHGLLNPSYIPDQGQRDLRDLTRYRTHLIQERSREINRVHKVLEDSNIKLSSVATDVMGVSGREMLAALIAGQTDPTALAQLAKGRLRQKIAELEQALKGHVRDSHRLLLTLHLQHIDELNVKLEQLEEEIDQRLVPFDDGNLVERLTTIPGISRKVAQIIIAELGTDMTRFPSANHAVSWAGLAPGKHESAGRNRSSRTNKGNTYLKTALVEAAHAAGKSKNNYLAAQFGHLAARRGKKRASVAVAHSLLIIAYHIIARGTVYVDLGAYYLDKRKQDYLQKQLVKRLENMGLRVTLEPQAVA